MYMFGEIFYFIVYVVKCHEQCTLGSGTLSNKMYYYCYKINL